MGNERTTALHRPVVFELADLRLDTRQRAVFRGSQRIPMPRLTYELLHALADAAPDLLTHEDLGRRVWRGRPVTPETLAQRVLLLRRALGDDASNPRYLRGMRGVGYQLVPPVRVSRDAGTRNPSLIDEQSDSEDYEEAQRFFELSAKLDPASSRALTGLSFVHWQRAFLEIALRDAILALPG